MHSEEWTFQKKKKSREKLIFHRVFADEQEKNDLDKQFDLTFWPILRVNGEIRGNILLSAGACEIREDCCWTACKDRESPEEYCNGGKFLVFIHY